MVASLNHREGHGDPHLELNSDREATARACDGEVTSPDLSGGGSSLR
jgi:hypothetical protein